MNLTNVSELREELQGVSGRGRLRIAEAYPAVVCLRILIRGVCVLLKIGKLAVTLNVILSRVAQLNK